jgi:alcohol dehydrogenase (NADP+)
MPYAPDPFVLSPDGVDPKAVPFKTLSTGQKMPVIGMGTFGNDRYNGDQIAEAVKGGLAAGYRLIDCASVYGNEKEIGRALREVFASGLIKREELFISSKVWNDKHGPGDTIKSCEQTLQDLGLDYLDLYTSSTGRSRTTTRRSARSTPATPTRARSSSTTSWSAGSRWRSLSAAASCAPSAPPTSRSPRWRRFWQRAHIRPAVTEMELHPYFQQKELMAYMLGLAARPAHRLLPHRQPVPPRPRPRGDRPQRARGPDRFSASPRRTASTPPSSASSGPSRTARSPFPSPSPRATTSRTCAA